MKTKAQIENELTSISAALRRIAAKDYEGKVPPIEDTDEIYRLSSRQCTLRWVLNA